MDALNGKLGGVGGISGTVSGSGKLNARMTTPKIVPTYTGTYTVTPTMTTQILAIEEEMADLYRDMDAYLPQLTDKEQTVLRLRFYDFASWPTIAKTVYGEITEANIYKARKLKRNAVRKLSGKIYNLGN